MAIQGMLLTRRRCTKVAVEDPAGTREEMGQVDTILFNPVIKPTSTFESRGGSGTMLGVENTGIIEGRLGNFTCDAELRGTGGAAGSKMEPGIAALLQACAFLKATDIYTVASSPANHKTNTIVVYQDGLQKCLYGAMGNVIFEGEVGKRVMCKFDMLGIYATPADVVMPATWAPNASIAPLLAGGQFKLGATGEVARKISKFSLNMGCKVVPRADVNAASGMAYAVITDIDPVITFDLEAELVGSDTYGAAYNMWLAGTPAAISIVLGTGTGKVITFTLPKVQYRSIDDGDREGIMVDEITAQCMQSNAVIGTDDAVKIAIT